MGSLLPEDPSPSRVLIIGLGGGTLPAALRKVVPAAHIGR